MDTRSGSEARGGRSADITILALGLFSSMLLSCGTNPDRADVVSRAPEVTLTAPDTATCRSLRSRWILLKRDRQDRYSLNTEPKDSAALEHWIRQRFATFPESIRVLVIGDPVAGDTTALRWILADLKSVGARGVAVDSSCAPRPFH
jgi:hypothetical protein